MNQQNRQQANYKDSTVNVYIVGNEWDATFNSKLKGSYDAISSFPFSNECYKYLRFWLQ